MYNTPGILCVCFRALIRSNVERVEELSKQENWQFTSSDSSDDETN